MGIQVVDAMSAEYVFAVENVRGFVVKKTAGAKNGGVEVGSAAIFLVGGGGSIV